MSIELPPLPDLSMFVPSDADRCQMKSEIRAYARAAVDAALERAAQECERIPSSYHDNDPRRCAEAIRALKSKPEGA